jgi:hypothetical protein
MKFVKLGEVLPLFVAVEDESTDKVIKANVVDPLTGATLNSDVVLSYIAGSPGFYKNSAVTMPNKNNLLIFYYVYESNGTTLIEKAMDQVSLFPSPCSGEIVVGQIIDFPVIGIVEEVV